MVKQQQNVLDGGFKSTPVHADGIVKGKSRRNKGNLKEKSHGKSKEKPSDSYKEKNADQKCQRCLGNCTQRKRVLHASPSVTSVQDWSLGAGLKKFKTRKSI